jgi:peptide/nickel transport system substrate-binding protein
MRHIRWQFIIAILGMLLVGGLLAGKGQHAVQVSQQPTRGGTYTEALIGTPHHFNPLLDSDNPVDRDVDRLLFSGLTRFNSLGRPVPDLGNWIISDDQLSYTFVLRADARWHDGQPVTSADVAFTVGLMQDPGYSGPADLGKLWQSVSYKIVNDQTISFTLPEPYAPFLDFTAFGLLPQHLLSGTTAAQLPNLPFNSAPVGSGPFKFAGLTGDKGQVTGVQLTAFDGYHGPAPLLNDVLFKFYPDDSSALAAYQAGDVLGISRIDAGHLDQALRLPQLGVYSSLMPQYSLIFLNLQNPDLPFFQDKRVRQALLRGLNRAGIINQFLHGQGVVANSPILPGSWAFDAGLPTAVYDPTGAARLLDSAGWVIPTGASPGTPGYVRAKGNQPLSFALTIPDDPLHQAIAKSAQATWAGLGVVININAVDPTTIRDQVLAPRPRIFDAVLVDLNLAGTPDPDPYPLWHQTQVDSGQNYGGFDDRISSQLLEQARITLDLDTRARLYYSFQSRFVDQVPALLLYYPVYNYGVDASVHGVQAGLLIEASDRLNSLAQWSVVTRRVIVEQPPVATPKP